MIGKMNDKCAVLLNKDNLKLRTGTTKKNLFEIYAPHKTFSDCGCAF